MFREKLLEDVKELREKVMEAKAVFMKNLKANIGRERTDEVVNSFCDWRNAETDYAEKATVAVVMEFMTIEEAGF